MCPAAIRQPLGGVGRIPVSAGSWTVERRPKERSEQTNVRCARQDWHEADDRDDHPDNSSDPDEAHENEDDSGDHTGKTPGSTRHEASDFHFSNSDRCAA